VRGLTNEERALALYLREKEAGRAFHLLDETERVTSATMQRDGRVVELTVTRPDPMTGARTNFLRWNALTPAGELALRLDTAARGLL